MAWTSFFLVSGALLLSFRETLTSWPVQWGALIAAALAAASVLSICRANPRRPISLGTCYAGLFGIFHIGLLIPVALGAPARLLSPLDLRWMLTPGFSTAVWLVSVSMSALSLGYVIRHPLDRSRTQDHASATPTADGAFRGIDGAGLVGAGLALTGIATWVFNLRNAGVALIGTSYGGFLAATSGEPMPVAYLLMGFGMGVASASRRPPARRMTLVAFGLWSIFAFTLGLRGEVLIPAASYLVVAARRRDIRLRPWMGLAATAALAAGSAVRVVRQFGLGGGAVDLQDVNPLDGLTELGYSIRPLVVVSNFHDRLHEPFVGLDTYWAPLRRLVVGRLLGGDVVSAAQDPAVFSAMIQQRVGPIGGSPAAEAYRVGGVPAVISVMFLIGLVAASLDLRVPSPLSNVLAGSAAYILLLWVRNDFTPVPLEVLAVIPLMGAVRLVDRGKRLHYASLQLSDTG